MAEEVTNFQHSKVLRTLGALLFRPGFLSAEYFTARRIRYLKPFTLTLAVLALHLFAFSVTSATSMYDIRKIAAAEQARAAGMGADPKGLIAPRIKKKADRQGVTAAALEEEINDKWARNASLLQIPLIVVYALLLQLVHLFSRRYFAEHLVFSMHLISFTGLTVIMLWPVYYFIGTTDVTAASLSIMIGKFLLDAVYVILATRSFYRRRTGKAVLLGLLSYVGYYLVFMLLYQLALMLALLSAFRG